MKIKLLLIATILFLLAFKHKNNESLKYPNYWPKPKFDFNKNPLDSNKIMLGRVLFYDPILSRDNTISCASCHLQQTAFTHIDHELSHGIDGRIGKRNSIALVNLAWADKFMWDGAIHNIDVQALAPIHDFNEMDFSLKEVLVRLNDSKQYKKGFNKAYGDTLITGERVLKSIAQFCLTLVSDDSKYDKIKRQEKGVSFSELELKGYQLFLQHCNTCHKEPLFTDFSYANNGIDVDTTLNDYGRMKVSLKSTDSLKFRVPSLRNIMNSAPYMHDGRYKNIQMVLFHYSSNVKQSNALSERLSKNIELTENDKRALIEFLKTLTDKSFLTKKDFGYMSPNAL